MWYTITLGVVEDGYVITSVPAPSAICSPSDIDSLTTLVACAAAVAAAAAGGLRDVIDGMDERSSRYADGLCTGAYCLMQ